MNKTQHKRQYIRFTQKLKAARIQVGLTQMEAAKKLKKPQTYVSKCELGERRVDVIELAGFARIYDKSITYFG
ncbi:MAG: helix-turn-helix transcriptional regulator [bacterium]